MTQPAPAEASIGADFRRRQAEVPLRPYDVVYAMDRWRHDARKLADETIDEGWQTRTFPRVSLDRPIDWADICSAHSAWDYYLHCWEPLGRVLATHSHTSEFRYLEFAVELILDWWEHHPSLDVASRYAWYDMAIGARSYRLAYVLDAACRHPEFSDEEIGALLECTMLHVEALRDDERFAAHSNHGFYFAAGQIAVARRLLPTIPEMETDLRQAHGRLIRLVDDQFAPDGVHREHSTDYFRMVLSTFENLIESGLLEGPEFVERRDRIQNALAWFVLPDGYLTMFGDSPHRLWTGRSPDPLSSDTLKFQASGGAVGTPPGDSVRAFPDGGFAVLREGWPASVDDFADWGFLAQIAAFHSRVHKHADDLSFVWYDRGHEILIDPGRFGYGERAKPPLTDEGFYYADPRRIYVESTAAHNTVEIDGRSYNRKEEEPYGSALRRCGQTGDIAFTEAAVVHAGDVTHERVLLYRPSRWLLVLDWVRDAGTATRDVAQHFHFAPELEVSPVRGGALAVLPGGDQLHLTSLSADDRLPVVRGKKRPLRGWISRKDGEMEPCWSTGFRTRGSATSLATLLTFDEPPRPVACDIDSGGARATATWHSGGLDHRVEVERGEEFNVTHSIKVVGDG